MKKLQLLKIFSLFDIICTLGKGMFGQIILIAVLALIVGFLAFFIIKSIARPKRVDSLQKLISQGKYTVVERAAKSMIVKEPDNYMAHYYLGKAYMMQNRNELALMEYKFVNTKGVFGEGLSELAFRKEISKLYASFNQLQDALREYLLLTKLEPTNAENFFQCGKIYEQTNQSNQAFGFYKKTIQLNKKHAKAHAGIALILLQIKKYPEAKKEIDTALHLSPETYSNYYYLGKIQKESKDYGAAIKAFEKAQRDPEYKQKALIERGTCYMMGNMIDNAIPEFTRAIDIDKEGNKSDTLFARYFLASCYEKNRKIEKAIEQWQKINAKNRNFRDVPTKLDEYKDLAGNDSLKEYLTSNNEEFNEICRKTCEAGLSMSPQSVDTKKWGCQITATESKKDGDWMSVRKQLFLLRFYRNPEPIDDAAVRETLDMSKDMKCQKAYMLSSSGFTKGAGGFAENRPIELVGKEKLEAILQKAGI